MKTQQQQFLQQHDKTKYKLPKLKSTLSINKLSSSIFHKQKRKYLIQHMLSQTCTNGRQLLCHSITNNESFSNIGNMLKSVRNQYQHEQKTIKLKKLTKITNLQKIIKKQLKTQRLQKKVISINMIEKENDKNLKQKQKNRQSQDIEIYNHYNQTLQRKLIIKDLVLDYKPPHRYKTQMVAYQSSLIFFGGIGCQKNLTWAKINFNPQSFQLPSQQVQQLWITHNPPYYGHTMKAYKNYGYIYGGVNGDTLNDLIILNLKNMKFKSGSSAPFRRKQHAATMLGKYMLIHGGIQGNQTKNSLYYYDTETNRWVTLPSAALPFLSHHSMVTIPMKNKRKITHISQYNAWTYIFGGKSQTGQCQNSLYRLKIVHDYAVQVEQIKINEQLSQPIPNKRYACCFQYVQNGNILLYGGKDDNQTYDYNIKNGTYNDTYLYNIYRRTWRKQQSNCQYRQCMASTSVGGKVYIFGGFGQTFYADGNLTIMKISQNGNIFSTKHSQQDSQTRENIVYIPSTRRIQYS